MTNASSPTTTGSPRPGDQRRKVLNEEVKNPPVVSSFFPIERYYDAADKVYASFQQIMVTVSAATTTTTTTTISADTEEARDLLDSAYVYGKRYCKFVLEAIPEHNYYSSQKYVARKVRHQKQVGKVLTQLEALGEFIDLQEKAHQERLAEERKRLEQKRYEELVSRAARQQQQRHSSSSSAAATTSGNDLESSAMNKLELLLGKGKGPSQKDVGTGRVRQNGVAATGIPVPPPPDIPRDPSGEEPQSTRPSSTTRYRLTVDDLESEEEDSTAAAAAVSLPPPILPPASRTTGPSSSAPVAAAAAGAAAPPPPSYNEVVSTARNGRYHRRTFLGPQGDDDNNSNGRQSSSSSSPVVRFDLPGHEESVLQRTKAAKKRRERIPMRTLQDQYRQDYLHYQSVGKIQVSGIDTYQGRVSNSTNGCTVISALVAAHHLADRNGSSISERAIMQVIDRDCGPLLREIRSKLGLDGHALIIPSDVHDHLVDKKILKQDAFVGAAGGNVMDPDHMGEFLKLLSVGEDGKGAGRKAAATFFFREHVICIVKSAPMVNGNGGGRSNSYYDLVDSLPGLNNGGRSKATRTRCKDLDALHVLMRWYTSRKFSDNNSSYIDRNAWDDSMADFDPRVFQGFVWAI